MERNRTKIKIHKRRNIQHQPLPTTKMGRSSHSPHPPCLLPLRSLPRQSLTKEGRERTGLPSIASGATEGLAAIALAATEGLAAIALAATEVRRPFILQVVNAMATLQLRWRTSRV